MNKQTIARFITLTGIALATGLGQIASAQTTVTTTPGVPTTALGGAMSTNVIMVLFALSLMAMGIMIAMKDKAMQ